MAISDASGTITLAGISLFQEGSNRVVQIGGTVLLKGDAIMGGTGTGAVVTVLTLLGKVSGRNVRVRMDGGELAVDAEAHDGRIENLYLTGPAALVCAGEILDKTILDLIKKQEEKA